MNFSAQLVAALWPLGLAVILIVVARIVVEYWLPDLIDAWRNRRRFEAGRKWRSDRDLLRWLRGMRPAEFERYIASLFTTLGYDASVVGRSHDGGIDVVAKKDGVTHYIQCKKFITSEVPVGAVRDFYGAVADNLAQGKAYFITTNKFTLEAEKFAQDKPLELIDGFMLVKYIRDADMTSPATTGPRPSVCPQDGGALIERTGKFGTFLGCSNYPKCRFTRAL